MLAVMLLCPAVFADQSVTLAWDPNPPSENVTNYVIHYGNGPRSYPYSTNVGTTTTATVYDLQEGTNWFFAVTAVGPSGQESEYSNEVTNAIPASATNHVPTIQPLYDIVIWEDGVTNVVLLIMDDETPAEQLVVIAMSTNTVLVANSNLVASGIGAIRSLDIIPTQGQSGMTLITVVVSDGMKASSTSFVLTVRPAVRPPSRPQGLTVVTPIIQL
jgi:hypothetical protein